MLLADVLALASRRVTPPSVHRTLQDEASPHLLLDFATLTGTCISSLSNRCVTLGGVSFFPCFRLQ
jgi:leucyl aminopeptidase